MEDRLDQALAFANYRQTLNNQLQKLKIKVQSDLIVAKNGGSFTINRELISFMHIVKTKKITEVVIFDDNHAPILIDDVAGFLKEITEKYTEVTFDYHAEYEAIRKSRNVKSILDIKDDE